MIVLVGGEKGGTGKTTLAVNLSTMRLLEGHKVALVDTDPQQTAANWITKRQEHDSLATPDLFQVYGNPLEEQLVQLASQFDDVFVDTGGRDTAEMRTAMLQANLMLIPIRASQFDIWTLGEIDDLASAARDLNQDLRILVVLNAAPTHHRSRDVAAAKAALFSYEHLEPCNSIITDRARHRNATAQGLITREVMSRDLISIHEFDSLYQEVFE